MSATVENDRNPISSLDKSKQGWKPRQSGELKPCERCKIQHLKCIYLLDASKCQRCERAGRECVKRTKKLRFRDVPVPGFRNGRKSRKTTNNSEDTSLEIDDSSGMSTITRPNDGNKRYDSEDPFTRPDSPVQDTAGIIHETTTNRDDEQSPSHVLHNSETQSRHQDKSPTTLREPQAGSVISPDTARGTAREAVSQPVTNQFHDEELRIGFQQDEIGFRKASDADCNQPALLNSSPHGSGGGAVPTLYLDEIVKAAYPRVTDNPQNYLETILLRYFREELAPWFDICDPFHHFADILPQRAREAGPLRSALLTISARNLSHNQVFRSHTGIVSWQGHLLPSLTEELAISYHNECIRELLQLSLNQKKLYDETLLAAVVILRTDEEMLHEAEDKQLFLRIASLFIDAQLPLHLALPHTSPQVFHPTLSDDVVTSPSVQTDSELESNGLRQACFWTALRQDLHAAFLKQQSVKFPLSRCEAFRQLGSATDATWANRMVVFCADVLEFCYGSESIDAKVHPAYTNRDRWNQLRSHEKSLCASLPSSFEPMYSREPDMTQGEVFPSLFYLETTHVSGTTYIELARMLLGWFNPAIPKLGHGCQRATKAVLASNKKTLFRLCGIALSNSNLCPPSLVNAALGKSGRATVVLPATYSYRNRPFR